MKQYSIVYLIGILNICFVAIPMQKEEPLVTWFKTIKAQAEEAKKSESELSILENYYAKLAERSIPLSTEKPDPYQTARDIQAEARNIIISKAKSAENITDYDRALELYNFAPDLFKNNIEATEKNYRTYVEKEEGYKLMSWFSRVDAKALALEMTGNPQKAFFYYGLLADAVIPPYKAGDPYTAARNTQLKVYPKILNAAKEFENEEDTEKALEIYRFAPIAFKDQIAQLEKKLKEKNEEIAKAVEIAKSIIEDNEDAEKETDPIKKLKRYGAILQVSLSCPPEAPDVCKQAMGIQTKALNAMSAKADEFKKAKEYQKAFAVYIFAPNVFDKEIEKLKPLVDILPELEQLITQNKYDDAYKKLAPLISQGVKEAETYKKDLERQKAEQERLAKEAEEQPEREKQKKVNEKLKNLFTQAQAEAKKDMSQALKLYGQIIQEPIPPSSTPDAYKDALAAQSGARTEIMTAADELMNKQKYKEALAAYQLIPMSFYNELDALKRRIAKLPDLIKEQEQSEQFAREILEQEELAEKYLRQEQLKKALIQLTEKLRSLAQYITSPGT